MSKVSIIIPSYNRAEMLRQAIQSVLAQMHRDVEVIVVDDGSTDDTEAVVASSAGARYERVAHGGACAARNRGIAVSSGSYLLFLDSDDVLYDTAIEELVRALEGHPECGAAYCGYVVTSGPDEIHSTSPLDRPSGDVFRRMCTEHLCIVHSVLVRREVISLVGGFDERLRQFEDWDFWIRVSAETPFVFVPKHLVEYRRWVPGAGTTNPNMYDAGKIVLRKYHEYYKRGRLTDSDWQSVRHRFRGNYRGTWTALAFGSYWQKNYRNCLTCALKGFVAWPVSLLNRGVWVIIGVSAWHLLRARMGFR